MESKKKKKRENVAAGSENQNMRGVSEVGLLGFM